MDTEFTPVTVGGYTSQTYVGTEVLTELFIGQDATQIVGDQTAIAWYLDALGRLFEDACEVVLDYGTDGVPDADGNYPYQPAYGRAFTVNPRFAGDAQTCSAELLPFIGQFVGQSLVGIDNEQTQRDVLTKQPNLQRGSLENIKAVVAAGLVDGAQIQILENTNLQGQFDPWFFIIQVNTADVTDVDLIVRAIDAQKPAGLRWNRYDSLEVSGTDWLSVTGSWASQTSTWETI